MTETSPLKIANLKVPKESDFVRWEATKPLGVPKNVRIMLFHSLSSSFERRVVVAFAPDLENSTPEKTVVRYGVSHFVRQFDSDNSGVRDAWDECGRKIRVFDRPDRSLDLREWKMLKPEMRAAAIENLWKKPKNLQLDFSLMFPDPKNAKSHAALLRRTLKLGVVDKTKSEPSWKIERSDHTNRETSFCAPTEPGESLVNSPCTVL